MSKNPARAALTRIRAPFGWAFRKYRAARVFQIALKKLWRKEMQWDVPFAKRRPRWWLKGFLSRSAVLYELDQGADPNRYVTDVHRYFRTKNMVHARLQDIINNKLSTHLLLRSMDIRSPELIGVYSRGLVHFFPAEGRMAVADYLDAMQHEETVSSRSSQVQRATTSTRCRRRRTRRGRSTACSGPGSPPRLSSPLCRSR